MLFWIDMMLVFQINWCIQKYNMYGTNAWSTPYTEPFPPLIISPMAKFYEVQVLDLIRRLLGSIYYQSALLSHPCLLLELPLQGSWIHEFRPFAQTPKIASCKIAVFDNEDSYNWTDLWRTDSTWKVYQEDHVRGVQTTVGDAPIAIRT